MQSILIALMAGCLSSTSGPNVRALTVEGTVSEGQWSGVEKTAAILMQDGKRRELALPDLMSIRWPDASGAHATSRPDHVWFYLRDGSRFQGRITDADPRRIHVETTLLDALDIPLAQLAAIRFGADSAAGSTEFFEASIASRDPAQDTLLILRDGKVTSVKGAVESLAGKGSFRWRNRSLPISAGAAYGLLMAAGVTPQSPAPVLCVLHDDTAWAGEIAGASAEAVELKLTSGTTAKIPVARIREIRFRSARVRFLSDLPGPTYDFEPFLSTRWLYRADRSVTGEPMRLGGQLFDRGLGMHSQSRLTYELKEPYTQLAATIGIDDDARPLGSVVFRVLAGGKEVFNSGPVTGHDAPRTILVPVAGAKTIQLAVDFGDDLDVGDHADWANVRLIK